MATVTCPNCQSSINKNLINNMPPGGKVCPDCNTQYGSHWE
jgi:endogenous inhibitor of DNA gyrase (YacG/DUF329 family)